MFCTFFLWLLLNMQRICDAIVREGSEGDGAFISKQNIVCAFNSKKWAVSYY